MTAALPKISLVTPSYNQGHFLESTLLSVLSQDYPNLQYIVMDGGSTDSSAAIIEKYAGRLAYSCSEKDNGQYDAINRGFARATGEIMAWINSDDMYFPWTLRVVSDIMTAFPEVEWVTARCSRAGGIGTARRLDSAMWPASRVKRFSMAAICPAWGSGTSAGSSRNRRSGGVLSGSGRAGA